MIFHGQLNAFLALIINIGKAHHMAGHFAGRVITTVLCQRINAGHIQIQHRLGRFRGQATLQIDKLAGFMPADFAGKRFRVDHRVAGQARPLILMFHGFAGIYPQRHHRRAHRQRLAGTITNHTTVRCQRLHTQVADIALMGQKIVLNHLKVHGPNQQQTGTHRPEAQHKAPAHRVIRLPCLAGLFLHGRISTLSSVLGNFMPSFSRARLSTRA